MPSFFSGFGTGFRAGARPSVGAGPVGETQSQQRSTQPSSSTPRGSSTQLSQSQKLRPQLGGKGVYARGGKVGSGGKGLGGKVGAGIGGGLRRHR